MGVKKTSLKEVKKKYKRKSNSGKAQSVIQRKRTALKLLRELQGIGEGVWNEDAQKYINRLRENDRS